MLPQKKFRLKTRGGDALHIPLARRGDAAARR